MVWGVKGVTYLHYVKKLFTQRLETLEKYRRKIEENAFCFVNQNDRSSPGCYPRVTGSREQRVLKGSHNPDERAFLSQEQAGVFFQQQEDIHQARVAGRRLRTALNVFKKEFPPEKYLDWKKCLKAFVQSLGKARDLDLQISFLQEQIRRKKNKKYVSVWNDLLSVTGEKRRQIHADVLEISKRLGKKKIAQKIEKACKKFLVWPEGKPEAGIVLRARKKITRRLKTMLAYEPYVSMPEKIKELHAMRIAAKQLRYALEVVEPIYQGKMQRYREAAHQVQQVLGRLHDLDVWIKEFSSQSPEEGKFFSQKKQEAIETLKNICNEKREQTYQQFFILWQKLKKEKIWGDLKNVIRRKDERRADG